MNSLLSALSYTPQTVELENSLKPFIPDFIPAVGDIDAFLKVQTLAHTLTFSAARVTLLETRFSVTPCSL